MSLEAEYHHDACREGELDKQVETLTAECEEAIFEAKKLLERATKAEATIASLTLDLARSRNRIVDLEHEVVQAKAAAKRFEDDAREAYER